MICRTFTAFVFLLLYKIVTCSKILGIFPFSAKSHFTMFEPLLLELANRGHELIVISHFPRKAGLDNYHDISLAGSVVSHHNNMSLGDQSSNDFWLYDMILETEPIFQLESVQSLINSNSSFDLIITEIYNTDVMLGFVHKFQSPFIAVSSCALMPWASDRFGVPDNPSYIPVFNSAYSDRMSLAERFDNFFKLYYWKFLYWYYFDPLSQSIARRYFGPSLPPLQAIAKRTSLLLVNTHFSLARPRPLVPAVIEVGGMHIKPAKKLPQELEEFISGSKEGVVVFSIGSMIQAASLPDEKRMAFIQAFARLPHRVIWKWDYEPLPHVTPNVKLVKWLPQRDLLAHPNVRLFIYHSGLLGLTEAVYCGVPIVAMPLFGDQLANTAAVVAAGSAVAIDYGQLSADIVYNAMSTVLYDPKYMDNAKKLSALFKDRPQSALDTAVFWTEYVIRHQGAAHLQSASTGLSWYQYLLLDVITAFLVLLATLYISLRAIMYAISAISRKTHQD